MLMEFMTGGGAPLIAESSKALIEWTPTTFYVAAAVCQAAIIWLAYHLLGADPEYNTIPAALAAAAVGNVAAFFLKDFGVAGVVGTFGIFFLLLLFLSGTDVFRAFFVFFLVMASYGLISSFVTNRTPLDPYTIGGVPKLIETGGFKAEPIERPDPKTPDDIDD